MKNTPRLIPNLIAALICAIVAIVAIVVAPATSKAAWLAPLAALGGLAISALAGWLGLTLAAPEEDPDDLD